MGTRKDKMESHARITTFRSNRTHTYPIHMTSTNHLTSLCELRGNCKGTKYTMTRFGVARMGASDELHSKASSAAFRAGARCRRYQTLTPPKLGPSLSMNYPYLASSNQLTRYSLDKGQQPGAIPRDVKGQKETCISKFLLTTPMPG